MYSFFNKINSDQGFTLIEVLFSIIIISVIVLAGANYYVNSSNFVQRVNIKAQGLVIARTTLEEIKAQAVDNWDTLATIAAGFSINDSTFSAMDLLTDDYVINIRLSPLDIDGDGSNDDNFRKLAVNVDWSSSDLTLETLISKR